MRNSKEFCEEFGEYLINELDEAIGQNLYENHPELQKILDHMISTEARLIAYMIKNPSERMIAQVERMQNLRKKVKSLQTDVNAM